MITVRPFGKSPYGEETQLFIIENGTSVLYVTDYGARIVALSVPDKNGYPTDVVLGFDNASDYKKKILSVPLSEDLPTVLKKGNSH